MLYLFLSQHARQTPEALHVMRENDRARKSVTRAANKLKDVKCFEALYPVQAELAKDLKPGSAIKAAQTAEYVQQGHSNPRQEHGHSNLRQVKSLRMNRKDFRCDTTDPNRTSECEPFKVSQCPSLAFQSQPELY